LNSFAIQN